MKTVFLHRRRQDKLLIFFTGWGYDAAAAAIAAWNPGAMDVLAVSDYTQWDNDIAESAQGYREVQLVAWSLGVWAAALVWAKPPVALSAALAINGTLRPLNREYGIAPAVFSGTVANWLEPAARAAFYRRSGGAGDGVRTPEDQQRELDMLATMIAAVKVPENIFTRAVIGTYDRIFPTAAQRRFWATQSGVAVTELPLHHDFRTGITGFQEVIELGNAG